jgi:hypothetical protein
MMSSLAQRLLRMGRAPGFGRSSRIAIGKEAVSDEARRRALLLDIFFDHREGNFSK